MRRNDGLDAVRALACLLVLVHHSFLAAGSLPPWWLSLGGSGVGLFYVLSGYLVTRQAGGPVGDYARRRALRIVPGYLFAVAGLSLVTMTPPPAGAWLLLQPIDWTSWHGSFIGVAWTLRVEVFFYALAPLLVRMPTRWWWPVMAASLAGGFLAAASDPRLLSLPPLQLWRFLPGMLLARGVPRVGRPGAAAGVALVWAGCMLPYTDVATAAGGMLLVAWALQASPSWSWARLPASLTYPAYLWHGDLMRSFPLPIALAGTLAASLASWLGVERRALAWRQKPRYTQEKLVWSSRPEAWPKVIEPEAWNSHSST